MGERLNRHLGPVTSLLPGMYTTETTSGCAAVCCKQCGGIYDVPSTHTVDTEGRVVPALACPYEPCGFLDYVTLGDYREEILR